MPSNVQIDPTKSALQNLLNLVDSQNPSAPSNPDDVTVSGLTAVTVGSVSSDPTADTEVTLTGVTGHRYEGSVTVNYTREPLSTQVAAVSGSVTVNDNASAAEVLAAVCSGYGFIPSEISWVSDPVVAAGGAGAGTGTIQASNSLVYNDGEATVNLNWVLHKTNFLAHASALPFTDDAGSTITNSGVTLDSTNFKFGSAAAEFNGSSALEFPSGTMNFQANDFTIEAWIRPTVNDATQRGILCCSWGIQLYVNGGVLQFYASTSATGPAYAVNGLQSPAASIAINTWQHVAVVRSGNTWTIYINGVEQATTTVSMTLPTPAFAASIGAVVVSAGAEAFFEGDIQEVRVSNMARYTANFTPAAVPFTLD